MMVLQYDFQSLSLQRSLWLDNAKHNFNYFLANDTGEAFQMVSIEITRHTFLDILPLWQYAYFQLIVY